jgi:hypothetical protein
MRMSGCPQRTKSPSVHQALDNFSSNAEAEIALYSSHHNPGKRALRSLGRAHRRELDQRRQGPRINLRMRLSASRHVDYSKQNY